jgi:hypothetical protein
MAPRSPLSARNTKGEEVVNHYGAVRLRVTGSASLQLTLFSFDAVDSNILMPIPLESAIDIEPNRLANFTKQNAQLQIQTTNIDEYFKISKIIIFIKPIAKSFPETS